MMRSLAFKLTLAFLLVGITGAALVAVLVGYRTRSEFDRFVNNRDETLLVEFLEGYYVENGGWEGVGRTFLGRRYSGPGNFPITVVTAEGKVFLSNNPKRVGQQISLEFVGNEVPLQVEGSTVGWIIGSRQIQPNRNQNNPRPPSGFPFNQHGPDTDGNEFLDNLAWASAYSALIAVAIALILGFVLARTLTKPIRELTAVTQQMASGKLGHQVAIESQDEIGELALAFNQMSRDLAQNQRQRRQMTADIAHDLRTPLTVLRGYMEGLKDGRLRGEEKIYNIMFGEVTHLQHLVAELRTLSLADAGELSLNLRQIDPKALLERSGLVYIMQAEEKGLALRIEAAADLPAITVDSDRMAQVLSNLVTNAIHHTDQGEILLSAFQIENEICLSVKDSGSGIAAQDLPHIFNRFYRADQSRQRDKTVSSGLGLAIAKAIVEAHGGRITAVSPPQEGTTFTIHLPLK